MISLRDRWRRGWLYNYFAEMAPGDRALVLIALLLAAAIATICTALNRPAEPLGLRPSISTPYQLNFAAVTP